MYCLLNVPFDSHVSDTSVVGKDKKRCSCPVFSYIYINLPF